jgi:hypothetical protein
MVNKVMKGQSAMEYLMTYGWAILIIAIVLVAFFGLHLFSSPVGVSCRANSGFVCGSPIFSGNVLTVQIGQGTGNQWTSVGFFMNGTGITGSITGTPASTTLSSGSLDTVTFTVPTTDSSPGNIYASYTFSGSTYNSLIGIATFP